MVDASTEILRRGSRGMTELPDKVATGAGVPAAPAGDRRAESDDDRSWNAAVSEGWPASPSASLPTDRTPGGV